MPVMVVIVASQHLYVEHEGEMLSDQLCYWFGWMAQNFGSVLKLLTHNSP